MFNNISKQQGIVKDTVEEKKTRTVIEILYNVSTECNLIPIMVNTMHAVP